MQKSTYKAQKTCESCEEHPAALYCIECGGYLCPQCDSELHQNKLARRHQRILNSESDGFEPIKCEAHGEHVELLCADCECLICSDCYLEAHRTHAYQPLQEAFEIVRAELSRCEQQVTQRERELQRLAEVISRRRADLDSNFAEIKTKTLDNFLELEKLLLAKKTQIITELEEQYGRLSSGVSDHERGLEANAAEAARARRAVIHAKSASSGISGQGEVYEERAAFAIQEFLNGQLEIQAITEDESAQAQQDEITLELEENTQICLDLENVEKFIESIEGLYIAIDGIGQ